LVSLFGFLPGNHQLWAALAVVVTTALNSGIMSVREISRQRKGWRVQRLCRALFMLSGWTQFETDVAIGVCLPHWCMPVYVLRIQVDRVWHDCMLSSICYHALVAAIWLAGTC
jgi:hypothetical protein